MRCFLALLSLLLALTTAAADEDALVARILDTETDRVPKITVVPIYPRKARRDRVEGEVQVCFDIDRKGRTRRIAVRRSSHRVFERPSTKAVRASLFVPLKPDEALQSLKSCRTFFFSLVQVEN